MNQSHHGSHEVDVAGFDERVAAFGLDYGLFLIGYLASLKLLFPDTPPSLNLRGPLWFALWGALFLLYQAYSSSDGRQSVGKRIMGLRIVDKEGSPLGLAQGAIRSACYLASSIGALGFLWALFGSGQGWHDIAVGSAVVHDPHASRRPLLARAGALACLSLFAVSWMWHNVWAERYNRVMMLADAHIGFTEISRLEKTYHSQNGQYAGSLLSLATVSGDSDGFLRDMAALYDLRSVKITVAGNGYVFAARAKDSGATPLRFVGS